MVIRNALEAKLERRDRAAVERLLQRVSEARVDAVRRNQLKLARRSPVALEAFGEGRVERDAVLIHE